MYRCANIGPMKTSVLARSKRGSFPLALPRFIQSLNTGRRVSYQCVAGISQMMADLESRRVQLEKIIPIKRCEDYRCQFLKRFALV